MAKIPRVVFAAGSLEQGSGGIAELSRQVVRIFLEMQHNQQINIDICVLNDAQIGPGDSLVSEGERSLFRCFSGSRSRFALALLRSDADWLVFDHAGPARLQGLLPGRLARPYALFVHGVEMWNSGRADYHRTARGARFLVANSNYTADRCRAACPGLPPIDVCWPGKDVGDAIAAATLSAAIGPHAMLIVGRLDSLQRHKGHDRLIDALPELLRRVPDAQLVIAGGGDDRARLEARAAQVGVSRQVVFTGRLGEADLHALYEHCALFVMPSDGDGFGMVFLEAMMHRLPCVGQAGTAADEVLGGGAGMLVDRDDVQGMARRLAGLLQDEPLRVRLGEAGRARYDAQFTVPHYARRLREVFTSRGLIPDAA